MRANSIEIGLMLSTEFKKPRDVWEREVLKLICNLTERIEALEGVTPQMTPGEIVLHELAKKADMSGPLSGDAIRALNSKNK